LNILQAFFSTGERQQTMFWHFLALPIEPCEGGWYYLCGSNHSLSAFEKVPELPIFPLWTFLVLDFLTLSTAIRDRRAIDATCWRLNGRVPVVSVHRQYPTMPTAPWNPIQLSGQFDNNHFPQRAQEGVT